MTTYNELFNQALADVDRMVPGDILVAGETPLNLSNFHDAIGYSLVNAVMMRSDVHVEGQRHTPIDETSYQFYIFRDRYFCDPVIKVSMREVISYITSGKLRIVGGGAK